MPLDNSQKKNVLPGRPLMPRLAATATSTKSPQAPKLAQHFSPNSSPLIRSLPTRNDSPSTRSATYPEPTTPSSPSVPSNVTPRSSSRRSRTNSTASTPRTENEETPTRARPISIANSLQVTKNSTPSQTPRMGHKKSKSEIKPVFGISGAAQSLTSLYSTQNQVERSLVSPSSTNSDVSNQASSFFYASDASQRQPVPQRPQLQKKTSSFLYANTILDSSNKSSSEPERPVHQVSKPTFPKLPTSTAQSSTSSLVRTTSPQREPTLAINQNQERQSATSALRGAITPQLSRRQSHDFATRKISLDSNGSRPYVGFASLNGDLPSNLDHEDAARKGEPQVASPGGLGSPVLSPFNDSREPLSPRSERGHDNPAPNSSDLNSPQRSRLNYSELAANARRERKVMDLEISNSSLLAINRSLEREVRKQKAELRRFRRLSRRSYSSWYSDSPSETSPHGLTELVEESEEDLEEVKEDDDEDSSGLDSQDEDEMSPTALAESDERHLRRDQRRLNLDLNKHKELLVDSQKMNQSLRRCLEVTGQLIKDGEKALQYRVLVSDVDFGGRVLSPEEQEDRNLSIPASEAGDTSYFDQRTDHYEQEDVVDPSSSPSTNPFSLTNDLDVSDKDSGIDVEYVRRVDPAGSRGLSSNISEVIQDPF